MHKGLKAWAIGLAGCLAAAAAPAAVVHLNQQATFVAPSQSFWGPGGAAASFASSAMFGSHWLGVSYGVAASTGTIGGSYGGQVAGRYSGDVDLGSAWSGVFSFSGIAGYQLSSLIGAQIDVTAHALQGDVCILCANYALSGQLTSGPALDRSTTASDKLIFASPGIGANIGVGSIKAGVDLAIQQNLKFTPLAVSAVLEARSPSGRVLQERLLFDTDGASVRVAMVLPERGLWQFDFTSLQLVNQFDNDFVLGIDPFVQYTVGVRCGDPGTNTDNGWFCLSDDKATFHLAGVNLYNGTPFSLAFNGPDLQAFTVYQNPEPAGHALLLAALGAAALAGRPRRRRGLAAAPGGPDAAQTNRNATEPSGP